MVHVPPAFTRCEGYVIFVAVLLLNLVSGIVAGSYAICKLEGVPRAMFIALSIGLYLIPHTIADIANYHDPTSEETTFRRYTFRMITPSMIYAGLQYAVLMALLTIDNGDPHLVWTLNTHSHRIIVAAFLPVICMVVRAAISIIKLFRLRTERQA